MIGCTGASARAARPALLVFSMTSGDIPLDRGFLDESGRGLGVKRTEGGVLTTPPGGQLLAGPLKLSLRLLPEVPELPGETAQGALSAALLSLQIGP